MSKAGTIFAEDFGTSEFKFGPATLGDVPDIIESRGYFPDTRGFVRLLSPEAKQKLLVVGPQVSSFLEAKSDIAERLVYPLQFGIIREDDERAWAVLKEMVRFGLLKHQIGQNGTPPIKAVSALASVAPRYMYERMFEIHKEINEEADRPLVSAVSIIPQPLAVAISQKKLACTVLEGGHGNTQVAPIGNGIIFNALVGLQRGGADCDLLAGQILRDAGYADLVKEPKLVKLFKEAVGLVPRNLEQVMADKKDPKFAVDFSIPRTKINVDLGMESWQRFLIGEYFFNPSNEIFSSYHRRGLKKPNYSEAEGELLMGETDLADVVIRAVSKVSFELQPSLYENIFLSGGNFAWKVPVGLERFAADAPTKLSSMLAEKGINGVSVELTKNPVYNVWQGCIAYGVYIPDDFSWDWKMREGWMSLEGDAPTAAS